MGGRWTAYGTLDLPGGRSRRTPPHELREAGYDASRTARAGPTSVLQHLFGDV